MPSRSFPIEQRGESLDVVRLDGAVGAGERLAALAQGANMAAQRGPGLEPVLPRDGDACALLGQWGVVPSEGGDRALGPVLGRGEQPVRPSLVVVELLVVGMLQVGSVRGDALNVRP
jgi:hypothetical protein